MKKNICLPLEIFVELKFDTIWKKELISKYATHHSTLALPFNPIYPYLL